MTYTWAMRSAPLLGLVLLACGSTSTSRPIANTAPPGDGDRLVLAPTGLGQLTANTPPTLARVRDALRGFSISDHDHEREDGMHHAFRVARGGATWLEIEHDNTKVLAVEIRTTKIATSSGAVVGQSFAEARRRLGEIECYGMLEEDAGNALCWSKATPTIGVILPLHDERSEYYGERVPPERYDAALARSQVERLVWSPGRVP